MAPLVVEHSILTQSLYNIQSTVAKLDNNNEIGNDLFGVFSGCKLDVIPNSSGSLLNTAIKAQTLFFLDATSLMHDKHRLSTFSSTFTDHDLEGALTTSDFGGRKIIITNPLSVGLIID